MSDAHIGRWVAATVALLALFLLPRLYLHGLEHAAITQNDEAIYAEMAREMVRSGRPSEISYDGELYFPRPPAAFWVLAAVYDVAGVDPPERPLRLVNAVLPALEVALTILLGCLLCSPYVGVLGGLLLGLSDLFVGYARAYESEPLLTCFVLGAFCAWAGARRRPWLWLVYGLCLGGALMTKQLIGLFPLAALIVDAYCRRSGPRRWVLGGLGVALLVAAPWHVLMLVRHGRQFLDSYLFQSLVHRARVNLLWQTKPSFYLTEIWSSEQWPFALLWLTSGVLTLAVGLSRGAAPELLLGGWAMGPLALYSMARSRYDYYILLSYPAFALAAAWLVARLPLRGSLRVVVAGAVIGAAAILHLPRNIVVNPGVAELRELLDATRAVPQAEPLYVFNMRPYAARVYTGRHVRVFVDRASDVPAAEALRASGMPAPAELASPPSAAFTLAERPSLLLLPRERLDVLAGVDRSAYQPLAESKHFILLSLPAR